MKKLLVLSLALVLALACAVPGMATDVQKVKIGATPSPHAEVLEFLKPLLLEKGIDLEIVEFTDYVMPNNATESGELDANYFQHKPYMDDFNAQNGTHMVAAVPVHFEPMAIYPGKSLDLTNIPDGAQIAVPNDPTNEARALLLLEANGVITIAEGKGLQATALDIEENPHNVKLVEVEAAQVPMSLADVDFAVINGNYALASGLSASTDGVAMEGLDSEAASEYINYLVVKEGNEESDLVKAFQEVLQDESVRTFFEEKYQGSVIPAF